MTALALIDSRIEELKVQFEQLARAAQNIENQLAHARRGLLELKAQHVELAKLRDRIAQDDPSAESPDEPGKPSTSGGSNLIQLPKQGGDQT